MSNVGQNIKEILQELPEGVKLVAVSKTKPISLIQEAYNSGQRIFGENKVGELIEKATELPNDIEWHFIGHLQRNKVKSLLPYTALIHGVDSPRLFREINKHSGNMNKTQNILLQVHIAEEDTKFGFEEEELLDFLEEEDVKNAENICISGLMGMATNTEDEMQVRREFDKLRTIFLKLQQGYFKDSPQFKELSMGMSGDYKIALKESSTMVRIGSAIFGSR